MNTVEHLRRFSCCRCCIPTQRHHMRGRRHAGNCGYGALQPSSVNIAVPIRVERERANRATQYTAKKLCRPRGCVSVVDCRSLAAFSAPDYPDELFCVAGRRRATAAGRRFVGAPAPGVLCGRNAVHPADCWAKNDRNRSTIFHFGIIDLPGLNPAHRQPHCSGSGYQTDIDIYPDRHVASATIPAHDEVKTSLQHWLRSSDYRCGLATVRGESVILIPCCWMPLKFVLRESACIIELSPA